MKKLILIITGGLLMTVSGFAQEGVVAFVNFANSEFYFGNTNAGNEITSAPFNQQPAAQSASTGVLDVGLYWSTTSFSDLTSGTLAGIVNMSSIPGLLTGDYFLGIPGTTPAEPIYVQIYAWDSSYGNSQAGMEACYAAGGIFMACSTGLANDGDGAIGAPEQVTLGLVGGPLPVFGPDANLFGPTVYSTPEPETVVIGGLGAGALLLFRRRRRMC